MVKGYLLSVKGLFEPGCREKALRLVDPVRREKALRCAVPGDCARSLGAGLLLGYGVREWGGGELSGDCKKPRGGCREFPGGSGLFGNGGNLGGGLSGGGELPGGMIWREISLEALLGDSCPAFEPSFSYGHAGKPYLAEGEPFFSLSHSGEYALCVFSDREVGADLQQMKKVDADRLAGRFFSEAERALIAAAETDGEKQKLFYRMWTRKEALGKLTGEGAAGVLALDAGIGPRTAGKSGAAGAPGLDAGIGPRTAGKSGAAGAPGLDGEVSPRRPGAHAEAEFKWVEYGSLDGYRIAVCFHAGC